MRKQIATAACSAAFCSVVFCSVLLGAIALSSLATAQPKTAKACAEEWQAGKTAYQADGVTEKAYVARCRALPGKAAGDRRAYLTVKDLMESIIDPSADALWGAVGTVADKQGIQDLVPKTPEEWLDVRRAVVRIIEGCNLLMIPGRDAAPAGAKSEAPGVELEPAEMTTLIKKKRKSFDAFARELQALGLEALRAAEDKNPDSLIEIGGRMEAVCEGCHQTFWYPLDSLKQADKLK
jgi:hypothetical protein